MVETFENHLNHRMPEDLFFLMRLLAIKLLKLLISYALGLVQS